MDIQQFIKNFSNSFSSNDSRSILPNTIFWDLDGWSSIVAISVVCMIEDEYGVTINTADMKGVKTVEELFSIVCKKKDLLSK